MKQMRRERLRSDNSHCADKRLLRYINNASDEGARNLSRRSHTEIKKKPGPRQVKRISVYGYGFTAEQ